MNTTTVAKRAKKALGDNIVPLIFIVICAVCFPIAGYSPAYLADQIINRIMRNSFLVLSLLIPIMAGMGLNFGMTLGAMAGQIGIILITAWNVVGIPGLLLAAIIATPIAVLLGWFCGRLLNMARGREMITSYMISFFMNGVYQLIVLYGMGSVIPIRSDEIILPRGYGVRNTIDLLNVRKSIDNFWTIRLFADSSGMGGISIPILTIILIALLCLVIVWFRKTKLGQDMRAVGQDLEVAREAGINVNRTRILSIIISTVFAAYGMIIYLSNMGTLNTYNSHSQIGMFSIAALLVGGASVSRASIKNVFVGIVLFHLMFLLTPQAGRNLIGQAQIGEFFRVFISYGVITLALVLYEIRTRRDALRASAQFAQRAADKGAGKSSAKPRSEVGS